MAFRCVDCDRVWKKEGDAESCCPHVEDIGDSSTTDCTACHGDGLTNSPDPNEECPACHGTGVAYKTILEAVLKQRRK
jgi:DnaJ-class molecular chaperone